MKNVIVANSLTRREEKELLKRIAYIAQTERDFFSFYWYCFKRPDCKGVLQFEKVIIDRLSFKMGISHIDIMMNLEESIN